MNEYLLARLIALSLAAGATGAAITPGPVQRCGEGLAATERAALTAAEDASLGALRAGLTVASPSLDGDERAELTRAQLAAAHLATLRGGITDRELTLILIVIGAVIVIALIA
jgi:hypothetical protein